MDLDLAQIRPAPFALTRAYLKATEAYGLWPMRVAHPKYNWAQPDYILRDILFLAQKYF